MKFIPLSFYGAAAAALWLMASIGSAQVTAAPTPAQRTEESALKPTIKDPKRHDQFLHRIKEGEINLLFLGDSIIDGWPRGGEWTWLRFAPYNPADFGISGDKTEHVLWRITNGELDGIHPKVAIVMIGTNNIGHPEDGEKPEWAAAGVKKILDTIHQRLPATKVLLLGVFPRDERDSGKRAAVTAINEIISKYGDDKTTYLDIGKAFLGGNGEIPADVMADKLHPTAKGYALWYEAMAPTLKKMME